MYNICMEKIETKLKKQGWSIETFQPKGEKYPWSLKISKKVNTKGLHTDGVIEKIRQASGKYVITAYLDVSKKLDTVKKEERIVSAIRWELIKNYSLLPKYQWLSDLQQIVGNVKPITFQKRVQKAAVKNSNEAALESKNKPNTSKSNTDKAMPVNIKPSGKTATKQAKSSTAKVETTSKNTKRKTKTATEQKR